EQRRDRERHGDEAAVELVPVVREAAVLPAQRLPGIAESEPGNGGADEHVLDDRLELPGPAGGDDHALVLGPHAEARHGKLAADEEQAHPEGNTAPERDVIEIV